MHILGVQLLDTAYARVRPVSFVEIPWRLTLISQIAFTKFYGIGHKTSQRICARLGIHDTCRVSQLTPTQTTALAAFLSSPQTAHATVRPPVASLSFKPAPPSTPFEQLPAVDSLRPPPGAATPIKYQPRGGGDQLRNLKIEAELKREMRENIAHQRMIGSYVGKRHAMGYPVRGQNTQNNARTARKLNKIERAR